MRRLVALTLLAALASFAPAASARSPLGRADMRTIRKDAAQKAQRFRVQYHAATAQVVCGKTTPFSARCIIQLARRPRAARACSITLAYVVAAGDAIAGTVVRDTC